jgi:NCS1 family nucleobase:cation symporter-1
MAQSEVIAPPGAQTAAQQAEADARFGIIPVLKQERTYNLVDLMLVAGSFAIATWCYTQGAAVAGVTNPSGAIISTFGIIIGAIPLICLIGIMSNRYGIDHYLLSRASWGYIGAAILTPITLSVALGFFVVNISLYGSGMSSLFASAGWEGAQSSFWLKTIGLTCPIIGFIIAINGVSAVKWATRIMGIALVAVGGLVLVLILTRVNLSEMWALEPLYGGAADRTGYMLSVEWNLAFVMSWYPCIGTLTRITRDERSSLWGLWFGYAVLMALYIVIGILAAFAATTIGAEPTGDPTDYMIAIGGAGLGSLALILVAAANITTAAVGIYSLGISMKIVFPVLPYKYLAAAIALLQCGLWLWGGIMTYYGTFLAYGGILCGSGVAILVVDYWILRRRRVDLHSVFRPGKEGSYWYTGGFNIPAFIAMAAGVAAFLIVYDPIAYAPRLTGVFDVLTATGTLLLVTSGVYMLLYLIPPVRRYMRKDNSCETCC